MLTNKAKIDLTREQIAVIEAALHTQEKILKVQSRAGTDSQVSERLNDVKSVIRALRRQDTARPIHQGWGSLSRAIFG